ncbi:hypothetical protein L345_01322, partial [Ophiophagus hannah]
MLAGPSDKCPPEPPGAGPLGSLRKVKVTSVVRHGEDVIKSYHAGLCRRQTPSHKGTCLEYILAVMNVCQRLDKRSPGQRDQEAPERRRIASVYNLKPTRQHRKGLPLTSAAPPSPPLPAWRNCVSFPPSAPRRSASVRSHRTWVAAAAARTCRGSNQGAPRALFFVAEPSPLWPRRFKGLPRRPEGRGFAAVANPRLERKRVRTETRITVRTKGVLKHGAICVRTETRFGDRFGSGPRISAVPKTSRLPQPLSRLAFFFFFTSRLWETASVALCPPLPPSPFYLFPLPSFFCWALLCPAMPVWLPFQPTPASFFFTPNDKTNKIKEPPRPSSGNTDKLLWGRGREGKKKKSAPARSLPSPRERGWRRCDAFAGASIAPIRGRISIDEEINNPGT